MHLVFEWLKAKTGAQLTHIPYGGAAPAIVAFERGDAHLLFPVGSPAVLERIKSGLAKPIAVPEGQNAPTLPGVPSFSAAGLPPYNAKTWFGAFAPAGTPKDRIDELSRQLVAVIKSPAFYERFLKLGGYDPVGNTPEEFRAVPGRGPRAGRRTGQDIGREAQSVTKLRGWDELLAVIVILGDVRSAVVTPPSSFPAMALRLAMAGSSTHRDPLTKRAGS